MALTVKDLMSALADYDESTLVVLSQDSEGNGFSPLAEVGLGLYIADSTWSGEYYDPEDDDEFDWLDEEERAEERAAKEAEAVKAVFFWPTN